MSTILFAYKFIKLERFNNKDYKRKVNAGILKQYPTQNIILNTCIPLANPFLDKHDFNLYLDSTPKTSSVISSMSSGFL